MTLNDLKLGFSRPTSLSDQIYSQIRDAILIGELPPGQRLTEMEIAVRLGTSQAPVREALKSLEKEGLVEKQPRSGTYVSTITPEDFYDLFQIRALIEKSAIKRTVHLITPEQCDELGVTITAMQEAAEQNNVLLLGVNDMGFHKCICEWSGNSALVHAWLPLSSQIMRFLIQDQPRYFSSLQEIAEQHKAILEALRIGDEKLAVSVIEEHVMLSFRRMGQAESL